MSADSPKCPHCEQTPARAAWPFCSWCGLFLVELDELDLSPQADVEVWRKITKIVQLIH